MKQLASLLLLTAACSASDNLGDTPALGLARWTIPIAGAGPLNRANTIAFAPDGDLYVAGSFNGSVDFGSGPTTAPTPQGVPSSFISKRAGIDGSERWTKIIGSIQGQIELGAITSDDTGAVYISGRLDGKQDFGGGEVDWNVIGEPFIAKYAVDGSFVWVKGIGKGSRGIVAHLAIAPDGDLFAIGGCEFGNQAQMFPDRTISCDATHYSGFIARYAPDGTLRWDNEIPSGAQRLAILPDGSAAVSTSIDVTTTFAGTTITAQSSDTPVVVHVTADGTLDHATTFGDPQIRYAPASLVALDDGSLIAGWNSTTSNQDVDRIPNLSGIDASGAIDWNVQAVQGSAQIVASTVLANGAVITAGSIDNYVADLGNGVINGDGFLASYAPDGSLLEARPFGDNAGNKAIMAGVTSNDGGAVAFAGSAVGTPDFGTGPVNGGASSLVIGLIDPPAP